MNSPVNVTVDEAEVAQFSRLAGQWWDACGPFAPLHALNPVRLEFITRAAGDLRGKTVLDIGCGGGLATEPLARLGARVTGIDASEKNISVARAHAAESQLTIDYRCATAEALVAEGRQFDVVLALEIIEHVADVDAFAAAACALARPGGLIIFSTLNRTAKAFVLAIVGAEYICGLLPRGTHDWKKFLRPSELAALLERHGAQVQEMAGLVMHPLSRQWRLDAKDLSVNYLLAARKAG